MDFLKLYDCIEEYRPLPLLSSLPVIVEKGGKKDIIWFNYNYTDGENGEDGTAIASSIFKMDDAEQITEKKVAIQEKIAAAEEVEPEMDEEAYYEALAGLYENFNQEKMNGLLQKAAFRQFLKTYEAVIDYCMNDMEKQTEIPKISL